MTREEILSMARKAGFQTGTRDYANGNGWMPYATPIAGSCLHELERFADLVAERERETCLEIADQCANADMHASMAANAIRARSTK